MVCVIILNWQTFWHTQQQIRQLAPWLLTEQIELIICDNGSMNDSVVQIYNQLTQLFPKVTLIYGPLLPSDGVVDLPVTLLIQRLNLGYGTGNNRAFELAISRKKYDSYLLLNNDCLLDDELAAALFKADFWGEHLADIYGFAALSTAQIDHLVSGGGAFYFTHWSIHRDRFIGQSLSDFRRKRQRHNYLSGASLFIPQRTADKLGSALFDEQFFLYCEEIDLFQRHDLVGEVCDAGAIYHQTAGSTALIHGDLQTTPRRRREYFENRSAYLFAAKQASRWPLRLTLLIRLLVKPLKILLVKGQLKDVWAFWLATSDFLNRHTKP